MSILLFEQVNSSLLAVQKLNSSNFSNEEIEHVLTTNKLSSKKRALEILSTKNLLKKMGEKREITHNTYGAPQISKDDYISISHSAELVAIILSQNKCGIDIENISNKAIKIYNKFENQKKLIENNSDLATLIWSAKECVFKLHQKGNINFKEDIKIMNIDNKNNKISVLFKEEKLILNYLKINNHFLVYFCK